MGNGAVETGSDPCVHGTVPAGVARSAASARPLVRIDAVSKRYDGIVALDRVSLDILANEFFALLGPSGCGKTTLLRMLAGFESPDEGRILLDGEDLTPVPPHRRPVNMMFQSYALFPHLTVEGNVAFGLKQEGLPRSEIAARVAEMLRLVQLEGLGGRKPHQLSGGQRQRVALARSLVKRPRLLLLDEPLAALDKKLRDETQLELMNLRRSLSLTFVIVTHDQQEAMTVADRIGVMSKGQLMQIGTPHEIYEQPGSRWIADFIGDINLIEGVVSGRDDAGMAVESPAAGRLRVSSKAAAATGERVAVAVRPEKVRITTASPAQAHENRMQGVVESIGYLGDVSVYSVRLSDGSLVRAALTNTARLPERPIRREDRVWLSWAAEAALVLTR
jgi:putrescine transport system ATP-binding protein